MIVSWKIPLFKIYWDDEDVENISKAVEAGMNWAVGKNVEAFEKGISEYIGARYCATFNSGTSALHAAMLAHGIGKGDEVVVPSFTFIATANAPLFVGARPVFAEIEGETYGLDPEDVAERITSKTKAIIPVHYAGCPCKIKEIKEIAEDKGLLLIEDAAEAFGADFRGKKAGTFGDSGLLSFCQNKIITTGEGGAIITDLREVYEKLLLIRSHGRLETTDYFSSSEYADYVSLGFNFRMSNITAGLGISQLGKVEKIIAMRKERANGLTDMLERLGGVGISLPKEPDGCRHVYQMYTIALDGRDKLMEDLGKKGIMTKVYFYPVHLTSFYKRLGYDTKLPETESISERVLTLPMHPAISREELGAVAEGINECCHR